MKLMRGQGKACAFGAHRRGLKWLALLVVLGCGPSAEQNAVGARAHKAPAVVAGRSPGPRRAVQRKALPRRSESGPSRAALPAHAPRLSLLAGPVMPSPGRTLATGQLLASADPSRTPPPSQATPAAPTQAPSGGTEGVPEAQRAFSEFLLIHKNGDRIKGSSGSLAAARLTGVSMEGQPLDIAQDDIHTLYLRDGTRAGEMALYGGGVGLFISGLVLLRVGLDSPELFREPGAGPASLALVGGSTALGALIGLAVGAAKPRWRVEPVVVPGQQYSLQLSASL